MIKLHGCVNANVETKQLYPAVIFVQERLSHADAIEQVRHPNEQAQELNMETHRIIIARDYILYGVA